MLTGAAWLTVMILALLALGVATTIPATRAGRLARVTVEGAQLIVTPLGVMKVWAFRRRLTFPMAHVIGISVSPHAREQHPVTLRLLGTGLPGVIGAGIMLNRDGGRSFWIYGQGRSAITIDLRDEGFRYVCVEVEDPAATCAHVREQLRLVGGPRPEHA